MKLATIGRSFGRRGGLALILAVGVIGAILVVIGVHAQQSAPTPPRSVGSLDNPVSPPATLTAPLGPSRPVEITIGSIGVKTAIYPIGLAADGTLAVPQPGPHLNNAAWFKNSPTPGQPGPSIIEGHLDSDQGPSVFFKLGAIRPGDKITIIRDDNVRVVFTVDAVRDFQKSSFPTNLVYGGKNRGTPTLRLITCSDFNTSIRHHLGNEVVFAHLTKVSNRPTQQ